MRGWHGEPVRHSMAARGIETKSYVQPLRAGAEHDLGLEDPLEILRQNNNLSTILEHLRKTDNKVEWIADADILEDKTILINDYQIGTVVESFLNWNKDDTGRLVGFFHSHPPQDFAWFSSTDYILGIKIHNLRNSENKKRFPWTLMGLVSGGTLQLLAIKPKSGRQKDFEGLEKAYESDLAGTHERTLELEKKMARNGELVRFPEIPLCPQSF